MSHNIEHHSFSAVIKKAVIEADLQNYAQRATWEEGGGGLPSRIRWYDNEVCEDYEAARKFLEAHDRGWYDQLAVKYRKFDKPLSSSRLEELNAQLRENARKLRELNSKVAFTEFKAQFISCKNCGSKLNKDYIKRNNCVVCGHDMRSDTTKNAIARLTEKVSSLEKAIREEEKKLAKKKAKEGKEYWLVKIEYHT